MNGANGNLNSVISSEDDYDTTSLMYFSDITLTVEEKSLSKSLNSKMFYNQ